jgi:aryl-alcohol dehydrogenase-like predicted oxidoreductase
MQGCWQLAGGHGREVFDDIQVSQPSSGGMSVVPHTSVSGWLSLQTAAHQLQLAHTTICVIQGKLWAHAEAGLTSFDTADIYGPSEGASLSVQLLHAAC